MAKRTKARKKSSPGARGVKLAERIKARRKGSPVALGAAAVGSTIVGVLATGLIPFAAWNLYISPIFGVLPMNYWRALGLGIAIRATAIRRDEIKDAIFGDVPLTPSEMLIVTIVGYAVLVGIIALIMWALGKLIPKRPEGSPTTLGPALFKHPALGTYTLQ